MEVFAQVSNSWHEIDLTAVRAESTGGQNVLLPVAVEEAMLQGCADVQDQQAEQREGERAVEVWRQVRLESGA